MLARAAKLAEHPAAWLLPALLAAALLLVGIDNHPFWGDEADTAIFGRNVLRAGYPTAWDGRNLYAYRGGDLLNADLVEVQSAWLQYYLAAGGFALFGETTLGGRLPFAALGPLTVVAFYFFVRRLHESRSFALASATALAVWVPFLLFARQCRYYAPAMLAAVVMLHLWLDLSLRRPWRLAGFVAASAFFFHSQFVMFACFFAALFLAAVVLERRRERVAALLVAVPLIAALTLPWVLACAPYRDPEGRVLANARPDRWLNLLARHLRDYDRGGFFPALMLVPAVLWVGHAVRRRERLLPPLLPLFVVLAYTALVAFTSPQVLDVTTDADIRYCVPAIPLLVLALAQAVRWLWRRSAAAGALVGLLCFGTNLLTLGLACPREAERLRASSPFGLPARSLVAEYVLENVRGYETPYEAVVAHLARHAHQDDTVFVRPSYMGDPVLFYLGGRLRFVAVLRPDNVRLVARLRGKVPPDVYSVVRPDWVVGFSLPELRRACDYLRLNDPRDYELTPLDSFYLDTTRPELFWRTFGHVRDYAPQERVFILHRTRDRSR